jgi:hypothetical protein
MVRLADIELIPFNRLWLWHDEATPFIDYWNAVDVLLAGWGSTKQRFSDLRLQRAGTPPTWSSKFLP